MFKSTIKLFIVLFCSIFGVYVYFNIESVKLMMFGYEIHINLFVFILISFFFVKLFIYCHKLLTFLLSKIFNK